VSAVQNGKSTALVTVGLFWSAVLGGLAIPGLVSIGHEVAARHVPLAAAWQDFRLHLFAPGYNLFLVAVGNAAPFVVLALFLLLHLGTAPPRGRVVVGRRMAGVLGAWLTAFALSIWMHLSLTLHPDAQGGIALLFLPFSVLLLLPVGYGCGRLIGRLAVR
jgi:hypothetical protein